MIEYFPGTFSITKIDSVDDHLLFKIVFDDSFKVTVVLADLGFGNDALETYQISVFC